MKIINDKIRTILAAALLSLSLGAEAQTTDGGLTYNDQRRFSYFYLEAVNQESAGNLSAAADLFRHALEINANSPEVYYNLAGYYVTLRNDSMAKYNFQKAAELAPNNTTYVEKLGQFYINEKNYDAATATYEKLYALEHDNTDVITMLLSLYGTQNNYDKMIEMLNRLETLQGTSDRISLTKMQIYAAQGKKKEQENVLKDMIAKNPNEPNYRVMYCNWLMRNGRPKEAYKPLMQVLKEDKDNVAARLALLDYYASQGKEDKIRMQTYELLISPDVPSDTKMALLRQTIVDHDQHSNDSVPMLELLDKVLAQPQVNGDLYLMKAGYMALHHMDQELIDSVYGQALAVEPDNARARILLLQDLWVRKDYDKVIAISQPGQEYNPDDMAFYYFEGVAQYMKKDNDKALETFRKGVSQINKNSDPDIVADFYSIMGDILHEKGQDSLAFDSYEKCLKWKPDYHEAMNNYAYYLSEVNRQLPKAEQMSRKTIDAEPDNCTYLDTYAWILFQEGRYDEAKTYIVRAIENDTTANGVLLEHAGDIHYMCGDKVKALEFWNKAAGKEGVSAILPKKIQQQKYIKE